MAEFEREQTLLARPLSNLGTWFRERLNEARYGFPDGKEGVARRDAVLGQERLSLDDMASLAGLVGKKPDSQSLVLSRITREMVDRHNEREN